MCGATIDSVMKRDHYSDLQSSSGNKTVICFNYLFMMAKTVSQGTPVVLVYEMHDFHDKHHKVSPFL